MRKIKFKGKCAHSDAWVYGSLVQESCGDVWIFPEGDTYCNAGGDFYSNKYPGICIVKPETVGQFTGLKDKHGKEIYEGDVVEVYDFTSSYASKYKGEVCVRRGTWCVEHILFDSNIYTPLVFDDFAGRKTEVIGNIYDNPELFKQNCD